MFFCIKSQRSHNVAKINASKQTNQLFAVTYYSDEMVSAILSAPFNVFRDRLRQNVCTKSANNIYAKHNQYQAFQLLTGLIRNSHCPLVSRSFIEDAVSNFLKGYIDDVSVTEIFIYSNVFLFN